ncbi:MAG: hypothetical protein O9302_16130 [Cyclobacteriaceae bacterium]|jgi:hypothetical protein|nr:hypothetical protein [Cytophagales bacterium]MCZ8329594.1 hypothetical protein [Cyclobacteriaceae bacterium]
MNKEDLKDVLNYGLGSPGETTRVLTSEYMKLRPISSRKDSCRKILTERATSYSMNGFDIIDEALLERVLLKSDGEFALIIFADIFASNNFGVQKRIQLVIENLDIILEVIVENYNKLVDNVDRCNNFDSLILKAKEFINDEIGESIFEVKKVSMVDNVWESAIKSDEKNSEKWRKDGFGAWIYRDEYNKSTAFGWRVFTNQMHNKQLPLHWQNTEQNKDGNIICKVIANGANNVEYKSGCYIATVCYGNINSIEVIKLREFRDTKLSKSFLGRLFIKFYYTVSPSIAKRMVGNDTINKFVRKNILDLFIKFIQ